MGAGSSQRQGEAEQERGARGQEQEEGHVEQKGEGRAGVGRGSLLRWPLLLTDMDPFKKQKC